jgi:hypothetical protein
VRFEFESRIVLFVFLLSLFHSENRVCLSRGVQVAGAARRAAMRTGRLRGRVALCLVCTVHVETMSTGFLVEP